MERGRSPEIVLLAFIIKGSNKQGGSVYTIGDEMDICLYQLQGEKDEKDVEDNVVVDGYVGHNGDDGVSRPPPSK